MRDATGITLDRIQFTFSLIQYPATQHVWLLDHIRYWFYQLVWLTRNEAFTGQIIYGVGLFVHRLKTYLIESCIVDAGVRGDVPLERVIASLGG